jgi:hypothetical protein
MVSKPMIHVQSGRCVEAPPCADWLTGFGWHLVWNAALPLKPPPHALVSEIDRIAEHERAAPDDAVDAERVTFANGFV